MIMQLCCDHHHGLFLIFHIRRLISSTHSQILDSSYHHIHQRCFKEGENNEDTKWPWLNQNILDFHLDFIKSLLDLIWYFMIFKIIVLCLVPHHLFWETFIYSYLYKSPSRLTKFAFINWRKFHDANCHKGN